MDGGGTNGACVLERHQTIARPIGMTPGTPIDYRLHLSTRFARRTFDAIFGYRRHRITELFA